MADTKFWLGVGMRSHPLLWSKDQSSILPGRGFRRGAGDALHGWMKEQIRGSQTLTACERRSVPVDALRLTADSANDPDDFQRRATICAGALAGQLPPRPGPCRPRPQGPRGCVAAATTVRPARPGSPGRCGCGCGCGRAPPGSAIPAGSLEAAHRDRIDHINLFEVLGWVQ